jgi:hypothetical protein
MLIQWANNWTNYFHLKWLTVSVVSKLVGTLFLFIYLFMFPGMIHNLDFSGQFAKPYLVHHIPLADPGQDILLSATIMVLKLLKKKVQSVARHK